MIKNKDIKKELKELVLSQNKYDKKLSKMTNKLINPVDIRRYKDTFNLLPKDKGIKILDVGCWPCALDLILKKKGFDVHGISLDMSKIFRDNLRKKGIKLSNCDLEKDSFPFKDEQFDYILCTEVIEHMNNPYHLLNETNRVLKKGGKLLLTTPNAASLNKIFEIIKGDTIYGQSVIFWFEPKEKYLVRERHVREYTINELMYMLNKHNFRLEKVYFSSCGDIKLNQLKDYPNSLPIKVSAWLFSSLLRRMLPRFNSSIMVLVEKC